MGLETLLFFSDPQARAGVSTTELSASFSPVAALSASEVPGAGKPINPDAGIGEN